MSTVSDIDPATAWCSAVARASLDTVVAVTRCAALTGQPLIKRKGLLHLGQWAALFVPEELLGSEFDPDSEELLRIRYIDYPVATIEPRWLMPTASVRFGRQLTLVGPKQAMAALHDLWSEDRRFDKSIGETWA